MRWRIDTEGINISLGYLCVCVVIDMDIDVKFMIYSVYYKMGIIIKGYNVLY